MNYILNEMEMKWNYCFKRDFCILVVWNKMNLTKIEWNGIVNNFTAVMFYEITCSYSFSRFFYVKTIFYENVILFELQYNKINLPN